MHDISEKNKLTMKSGIRHGCKNKRLIKRFEISMISTNIMSHPQKLPKLPNPSNDPKMILLAYKENRCYERYHI